MARCIWTARGVHNMHRAVAMTRVASLPGATYVNQIVQIQGFLLGVGGGVHVHACVQHRMARFPQNQAKYMTLTVSGWTEMARAMAIKFRSSLFPEYWLPSPL